MVRRAVTRYRKVRDETDRGEDAGDIELLQQDGRQQPYERPFNTFEESQCEAAGELQDPTASTSKFSHDDEYLLSARPVQHRLQRSIKRKFLAGWRFGALLSLMLAASACIFNSVITIWVWQNLSYKIEGPIRTLFLGYCARVRKMNLWIHLLVNVLSTLLLCASNYCMQVLSAPTREELIRTHARRHWLHIGVPSLGNLLRIGTDRTILWILLFSSSVPLHLLFNSVVFTSLQANEYIVIPTTEDWLHGGAYDTSGFVDIDEFHEKTFTSVIDSYRIDFYRIDPSDKLGLGLNETMPTFQNISAADCFNKYNGQYISAVGNAYLIQETPTVWRNLSIWGPFFGRNGSFNWESINRQSDASLREGRERRTTEEQFPFLSSPHNYPSNGWQCPSRTVETCDVDNKFEVPQKRSLWKPYESSIKYCLVEQVEELCKLQFSFPIAIAVIASNFLKVVCMAIMLFCYRQHAALVTIGDAIASFLDNPDPETRGRCLYSRRLMEVQWRWECANSAKKDELVVGPEKFRPKRQRWGRAPSGGRWVTTYTLYFVAILFGFVSIERSLTGMPKDPVKLWKTGFGTSIGNNLLNFDTSVMGGVLLANTPQAILSYLYLAFNALYTSMFVAREWSTFIEERKPLRVTLPVGQQRDTYWLNVPFRYAIPMTIIHGLFHWLTSQSIFMVYISLLDMQTRRITDHISSCGYSPVAIILTTVTGAVIAAGGLIVGSRRYAAGMPLASSCSAAISAACHPLLEDINASLLPVQWGAVTHIDGGVDNGEPMGHCSFSSFPVEFPISGRLYA